MQEQFWQDRWSNNQIAFHNAEANPLLVEHFDFLSLGPGTCVFVPLCGKSRDIPWLAGQGYRVIGAELSRIAVKQFFDELGVDPQVDVTGPLRRYQARGISIYQGSIFDLTPEILGPINAIYDRGALVAMPDGMREQYASHLLFLTRSAPQLLISYEYDQTRAAGPPFSVTESDLRRLYGKTYDPRLLERQEVAGGLKGQCPAVEVVWSLGE